MDINDGRFRENGGCGYVLKPEIMRDHFALYKSKIKNCIPGVVPQLLHIKIISAQHLPRPRGSSAKGDVIDPYVIVQIHGINSDCAVRKTKTVSNGGECPVYEETFKFQLSMPESSLVRFVVLDDEYIGDDFIGQYTIPLTCMRTGYCHIRLLASNGEVIPNAALFVHISMSYKRFFQEGEKPLENCCCGCESSDCKVSTFSVLSSRRSVQETKKRNKYAKMVAQMQKTGIGEADDTFKDITPDVAEALRIRVDAETAMDEFRFECGQDDAANMSHCIKVLLQRLTASPQVTSISIKEHNGLPLIKVIGKNIPAYLHKSITSYEKALQEAKYAVDHCDNLIEEMKRKLCKILSDYEEIPQTAASLGLKGGKLNAFIEQYVTNVRKIKGQIELLKLCKQNSRLAISQVHNLGCVVDGFNKKVVPELTVKNNYRINVNKVACLENHSSTSGSVQSVGPLVSNGPASEITLRSILKKPSSNNQQNSKEYINSSSPNNSTPSKSVGMWM